MKKTPYYIVRNSPIHGRGVFARRLIRKGIKVIEYDGPIISRKEADDIEAASEGGHLHTMLFGISKNKVIDGRRGGNARYINNSCDPNCEAIQYDDQIFIESVRTIQKGEELTYNYHLDVPGKITRKVLREYACFCGSPKCRGTQISKSIIKKALKKSNGKKLKKELKALQKKSQAIGKPASAPSEATPTLETKDKSVNGIKKNASKKSTKTKTAKAMRTATGPSVSDKPTKKTPSKVKVGSRIKKIQKLAKGKSTSTRKKSVKK